MRAESPPPYLDEPLDIFGQNPSLDRLYTQLCFGFCIEDSGYNEVVNCLTAGLRRLCATFPWLAGQVVRTPQQGYKIRPLEALPHLVLVDRRNELPTMEEYIHADFPFSMLDEDVVAPRRTMPERFHEPAPVLLLQINFIHRGLLLVFSAQHNCMDMVGQAQVIRLFAQACRSEPFTEEQMMTGNAHRQNAIPLLEQYSIEIDAPESHKAATMGKDLPLPAVPDAVWVYFSFSGPTLSDLKSVATQTVTEGYISTDDAISAFVWQAVSRARFSRLSEDMQQANTTFERQVDARRYLDISPTYVGNATYKTSTSFPIKDLLARPLGEVASALRSSLNDVNIGHAVRKEATILTRKLNSSNLEPHPPPARKKPSSLDIKMSSWAKEQCYDFDFGSVLGKPIAVRRPAFEAWEGLAYMMPKKPDGEIAVALCLRREDIEVLRADGQFGSYATFVG